MTGLTPDKRGVETGRFRMSGWGAVCLVGPAEGAYPASTRRGGLCPFWMGGRFTGDSSSGVESALIQRVRLWIFQGRQMT